MTDAKHVFTIEITSEIIEPFTLGSCFYQTEGDRLGSGYVEGMVQDGYKKVLVPKYECIDMDTTNKIRTHVHEIQKFQ